MNEKENMELNSDELGSVSGGITQTIAILDTKGAVNAVKNGEKVIYLSAGKHKLGTFEVSLDKDSYVTYSSK